MPVEDGTLNATPDVREGPQACFPCRPGGNHRLEILLPRAGSVWKSDGPLDELMWTPLSNPEVDCVVLIQSISEAASHYDVKLCVQKHSRKKRSELFESSKGCFCFPKK